MAEEKKKVRIYSTPTCPYCKMVKEFLTEKGVKFEDVDVSSDQLVVNHQNPNTSEEAVSVQS